MKDVRLGKDKTQQKTKETEENKTKPFCTLVVARLTLFSKITPLNPIEKFQICSKISLACNHIDRKAKPLVNGNVCLQKKSLPLMEKICIASLPLKDNSASSDVSGTCSKVSDRVPEAAETKLHAIPMSAPFLNHYARKVSENELA